MDRMAYLGKDNKIYDEIYSDSKKPIVFIQLICLHLPTCGPGFESQAHHMPFYIVKFCAIFVIALRK